MLVDDSGSAFLLALALSPLFSSSLMTLVAPKDEVVSQSGPRPGASPERRPLYGGRGDADLSATMRLLTESTPPTWLLPPSSFSSSSSPSEKLEMSLAVASATAKALTVLLLLALVLLLPPSCWRESFRSLAVVSILLRSDGADVFLVMPLLREAAEEDGGPTSLSGS